MDAPNTDTIAVRTNTAQAPATVGGQTVLKAQDISKTYPGVQALKDMNFELRAGEVHVLFGENGAGKSTLTGIICGARRPSSGRLLFNGEQVQFSSVDDARRLGIAAVFQEFSLAPDLSVEDNLYLATEIRGFAGFLDKAAMRRGARETFERLGFDIDVRAIVSTLSRAQCQMVEIAKAIHTRPRVLILDEPTASLTEGETRELFRLIGELKQKNVGIIYISHRIGEIQEIGDRVTVMRDGQFIATLNARDATKTQLVELMTGRTFGDFYPKIDFSPAEPRLEIEGISTADHKVKDVSLTVRGGEIVGLAGLLGCGKSEIGRAVFGLVPISGGTVRLMGRDLTHPSPRKLLDLGLAYVPSDRIREGLMLGRAVRENLSLAVLERDELSRGGLLRPGRERRMALEMAASMAVRPANIERSVGQYSGGNMQKVLLGRYLASGMKVLILDEPTIGIDVGAKAEVYALLADLANRGVAVLLISSDLPEVLSLSHRVYIVHDGHISDELEGDQRTEDAALASFFGRG